MHRPPSGVAKGAPCPRCPQPCAQLWSPWGPLGLARGALRAVGASSEILGAPWAKAKGTSINTRPQSTIDRRQGLDSPSRSG
eukprot:6750875-Pyramimonas_sp.AAC.1